MNTNSVCIILLVSLGLTSQLCGRTTGQSVFVVLSPSPTPDLSSESRNETEGNEKGNTTVSSYHGGTVTPTPTLTSPLAIMAPNTSLHVTMTMVLKETVNTESLTPSAPPSLSKQHAFYTSTGSGAKGEAVSSKKATTPSTSAFEVKSTPTPTPTAAAAGELTTTTTAAAAAAKQSTIMTTVEAATATTTTVSAAEAEATVETTKVKASSTTAAVAVGKLTTTTTIAAAATTTAATTTTATATSTSTATTAAAATTTTTMTGAAATTSTITTTMTAAAAKQSAIISTVETANTTTTSTTTTASAKVATETTVKTAKVKVSSTTAAVANKNKTRTATTAAATGKSAATTSNLSSLSSSPSAATTTNLPSLSRVKQINSKAISSVTSGFASTPQHLETTRRESRHSSPSLEVSRSKSIAGLTTNSTSTGVYHKATALPTSTSHTPTTTRYQHSSTFTSIKASPTARLTTSNGHSVLIGPHSSVATTGNHTEIQAHHKEKGAKPGTIAAAVLVPLIVIALGIVGCVKYLRYKRQRDQYGHSLLHQMDNL